MFRYDCDYCGETFRWDNEDGYIHGVPVHVLVECRWMNGINRDQILRDWVRSVGRYSHAEVPLF